jgi:hypothetical protein
MLKDLAPIYRRVVPELDRMRFPTEVLATCSECAMRPVAPQHPRRRVFSAPAACCTYHPALPNFLVGMILAKGGPGMVRLVARMADPHGVTPLGIARNKHHEEAYDKSSYDVFGQDESLTCPYWNDHRCTIHSHRNAVCRTWFCKSLNGRTGHAARNDLLHLLRAVENALAKLCVADGKPPSQGSLADGITWYRWCADYVENLPSERVELLRGDALAAHLKDLDATIEERDAEMPQVLIPRVASWHPEDNRYAMTGYSGFDMVDVPSWIFQLLSRLDGNTTWRSALQQTEAELGHTISDDLIYMLYRRGILGPEVVYDPDKVNPSFQVVPQEPSPR